MIYSERDEREIYSVSDSRIVRPSVPTAPQVPIRA